MNKTLIECSGVTHVYIQDLARSKDSSRAWRTITITTQDGPTLELTLWTDDFTFPIQVGGDNE